MLTRAGHDLAWDAFFEAVLSIDPQTGFIRGVDPLLIDLGIAETAAGREALGIWFFAGCTHLIQPFDGLLDVAGRLARDHVLGVITNGPTEIQRRKFDALLCDAHFQPDLFITSDLAGCFKPEEAIFRLALQRAGVQPHEAVMVGDQPSLDIIGAQKLGMRAVWFSRGGRPPVDGVTPDATIASLQELPALLERWAVADHS